MPGGESALVDASFAHKSFVDEISSLKDNLKYIFLTHGHYDHILSVAPIKEATGKGGHTQRDAICLSSPAFLSPSATRLDQHRFRPTFFATTGTKFPWASLPLR